MAWENALDRLLLQQVHLVEKGGIRPEDVRQQIQAMHELDPHRARTAFHMGYGRALLGLDLKSPDGPAEVQRWYLFGRMRGHDRSGEQNWVADLLHDPTTLMDLLNDPDIAAQCLPLVMRTLFWCGDLVSAVKAIEYLATQEGDAHRDLLVDAALTDLLSRLEVREDKEEEEPTVAILEKCVQLETFERLPADVRSRYYRGLGARYLAASEFDTAIQHLESALRLAEGAARLGSSIHTLAALAELRLHDIEQLEPQAGRPAREGALRHLEHAESEQGQPVPDALFARGVLAYEVGQFDYAEACFDRCLGSLRRRSGRDLPLLHRTRFYLAAAILAGTSAEETPRALRLMDQALDHTQPDLETFYGVHEALKHLDRRIALKFLDAVDVGRGTAPDQLLFVALEYLGLAEAEPAAQAGHRVLQVAVDLDQRIEAMRVLLTARNMQGDRESARGVFFDMRDLLMQRGAFTELENVLKNEESVGQALDHVEIKCELVALYEEMEERDYEKAQLQTAIARSLRARKDTESLRQAFGLLKEVEIQFPELAAEDLLALEKLLALSDAEPVDPDSGPGLVDTFAKTHGRPPRVLVVGGNERQRRHHPRFAKLCDAWGLEGEWLMANYTSPQKAVAAVQEKLNAGLDLVLLLHWNRHETTEPALEAARKAEVAARTVHYAGFTSLQVSMLDALGKLVATVEPETAKATGKATSKGGRKA